METTMAATPKARMATASAPSMAPAVEPSGLLAFPVPPPPPNTARLLPAFAFPPPNDPCGPTRAQEIRPARRATVRVPRRGGFVSDSLAALASLVEGAPLPMLPDTVWTAIGRAWFFIAGTTGGILLALALIAVGGSKHSPPRDGHVVTASGTARVLVVQRAPAAAERGIGQLAENDLDEVGQVAAPPAVRRTPVVVVRRSSAARRAPAGKDLLSAGL